MDTAVPIDAFQKIVCEKTRTIRFTKHALSRSAQRNMLKAGFGEDFLRSKPVFVFEQESEVSGERKFDVYYPQTPDLFHRYVVSLNNEIRVITMMRVSKAFQRWVAGQRA